MKMLGVVKLFVLPYNVSMTVETKVILKLTLSQKTVSVAESCSGGLIAHRLTNVPGSSAVFLGGVVTYSNLAKQKVLRVPADLISTHGAVSADVALSMAQKVRSRHGSDYGLGVTGIAGPGRLPAEAGWPGLYRRQLRQGCPLRGVPPGRRPAGD